jgi:hypothetical protein
MRRAFLMAFIFAFATGMATPATTLAAPESHIAINNKSDKAVWVTAFTTACKSGDTFMPLISPGAHLAALGCDTRHIEHEWCTAPSAKSQFGFHHPVTVVHVLVTTHANCGRPIVKDWTLHFPHNNGSQSIFQRYTVGKRMIDGVPSYDVETSH